MSTKSPSQERIERMKQMPKEPIEGLVLAFGRQFLWCSLFGLILPMSAGVCYVLSVYSIHEEYWWGMATVFFCLTLCPLLVWFPFLGKVIRDKRELARLANGYYLASWRVPQAQWDARLQESRTALDAACWWIFRIVPAIGFIGGIIRVLLDMVAGGESGLGVLPLILPTGLNTIGYTVIGVILAWMIVRCVRFFANISQQIEDNGEPMVVVSETAVYMTGGVIRRSLHVTLEDVTLDASAGRLSFGYRSIGETVNRFTVVAPVPPAEERTAKALVRVLNKTI